MGSKLDCKQQMQKKHEGKQKGGETGAFFPHQFLVHAQLRLPFRLSECLGQAKGDQTMLILSG